MAGSRACRLLVCGVSVGGWGVLEGSCPSPSHTPGPAADAELRHGGGTRPMNWGLGLGLSFGLGPLSLPSASHTNQSRYHLIPRALCFSCSQPSIVCRQCPEYRRQAGQPLPYPGPGSEPGAPQAPGDAPSTSASVTAGEMATPSLLS